MLDLNDLRIFESVATHASISRAARAMGAPKSSVSRSVARLEAELGARLFQRTTREFHMTEAGRALHERCARILAEIGETADYVSGLAAAPRGKLRITAGISFGINVLSEVIPSFCKRYPEVRIEMQLESRAADLVGEEVDLAFRIGALSDSQLVARKLGSLRRYLCAAPDYLLDRPPPEDPDDLARHLTIEMPGADGGRRPWVFERRPGEARSFVPSPHVTANDALSIQRLVGNGAGIACISGYLCAPDLNSGRLVHLLPDWQLPSLDVHALFPSNRELSSAIRAFIDHVVAFSLPGCFWLPDGARPLPGRIAGADPGYDTR